MSTTHSATRRTPSVSGTSAGELTRARPSAPPLAPSRLGWVGRLIETEADVTSLFLRLTLAVVIFPHGAQKLLGWFGGYGFSGTMGFFTEQMGLPGLVAFLVIFIEFFGALALAAGALGRAAAAGIAAVMVGAVVTTHLPNGFFMNWTGAQAGEGFEFHLLALGIAAALILKGSGAASFDRWWTEERIAA